MSVGASTLWGSLLWGAFAGVLVLLAGWEPESDRGRRAWFVLLAAAVWLMVLGTLEFWTLEGG